MKAIKQSADIARFTLHTLFVITALLIFTNCEKKPNDNVNIEQKEEAFSDSKTSFDDINFDDINIEQITVANYNLYRELLWLKYMGTNSGERENFLKSTERIFDCPVKDIRNHIFEDLRLRWNYANFNEFFETINIDGEYSIEEKRFENPYGDENDFISLYTIKWDQINIGLSYSTTRNTIYFVRWFEIQLTEENYINLFPYKEMNRYKEDIHFGEFNEWYRELYGESEDTLSYVIRRDISDEEGYCYLKFDNGILKSIKITPFIP